MEPLALTSCKNCGNSFTGNFCNECGEKIYTEHDKSLKHLIEEVFHFVTHFDNKVFRTVGSILFKPGTVTRDYNNGIRKRYYKPVSLFLVCVMLYLLFPMLSGMNVTLTTHLQNTRSFGIRFPTDWALVKLQSEHITELQLFEKFNQVSEKVSKIMLLLLIPFTAFALRLLFFNKRKYFFDHFILAAEFNTYYLLSVYFLIPLISAILVRLFDLKLTDNDTLLSVLLTIGVLSFALVSSFRRVYAASVSESIVKLLGFIICYFAVVFIYRMLLFSVVMLMV